MSLLKYTPDWNVGDVKTLVERLYGISTTATPLPSERDQNFLLLSEGGDKFVLKIANTLESEELLQAQHQVLRHLAQQVDFCQKIIPTLTGKEMTSGESKNGTSHFIRLISHLPGIPLGELTQQTPELLRDLGSKIGQLDQALSDFDHAALRRDFHWDLANGVRVIEDYSELIEDNELREIVLRTAEDFRVNVTPLEGKLRRSVIHGDANDYNVLVDASGSTVTGIIDFGDMVHSYTVGDLAIAIAYVVLGKSDPVGSAAAVVSGYTSEYPLTDDEIEVLWQLVLMRLCMSVTLAEHQRRQRPDNEYLGISQQAIRVNLPMLAGINAKLIADRFRVKE
jgi:Ser/Thr protein kinase RdoA (MazF antagonist)